jgi:hypothetical protein
MPSNDAGGAGTRHGGKAERLVERHGFGIDGVCGRPG